MVNEEQPQLGSVSFWERITRLGLASLGALIILVCGLVAFFLGMPFTEPLMWAWWLALGFLFGGAALAAVVKELRK